MGFIKSRKHPVAQRSALPAFTAATLATSLALALPAMATDAAAPATDAQATHARRLQGITVEGTATAQLSSPKFTQPLLDTPQTIEVIGKELFQQQGATTLTEALRNTPGVGTFYLGENGSTNTGDAIYMRGFNTTSSIFVDGVRDQSTLSRDIFNIEQVEVTKGPDSTEYGRTAPSGAINMVTKQPHLGNAVSGSVSYGSENQKRATADWNQQISNDAAFRLNVLGQNSGVPGRHDVKNKRWGVAPSLALGLGTTTRVYLDFLHVKQNNVPDGGTSTIGLPGYTTPDPTRPFLANAHTVDPSNFYGTDQDHDDATQNMFTAILQHDFADDVTLHDTLRWGRTQENYLLTSFMVNAANLKTPDPSNPSTWTVARTLPNFEDQINRIVANQLNLTANFDTGAVTHALSAGIELSQEKLNTTSLGALNGSKWPAANLYHPDPDVGNALVYGPTGAWGSGKTNTAAAYLFDTLKFGRQWQVNVGGRFDHYDTDYNSTAVCGGRRGPSCGTLPTGTVVPGLDAGISGNLTSWQLALIYKPATNGSIYAALSTAAQPPGGNNLSLSSSANNPSNPGLRPERARTGEVGTKWNFFDEQLLLTAAFYRTTVSDDLEQDPTTLLYYQIGQKRVQGVEITATGQITPNWTINAGFASMHTHVSSGSVGNDSSTAAPAADGSNVLAYTPKNAFTSWTSYRLPFGLVIGGGVRYSGEMQRGTDNPTSGTPKYAKGYWVADAMASYPVSKNFDLQLNVYNLFNKTYVASINKSGYRYIPGAPRWGMITANFHF